jgi:hypothetical protein
VLPAAKRNKKIKKTEKKMAAFMEQANQKLEGAGFGLKAVFVTFDKESQAEACLAANPKGARLFASHCLSVILLQQLALASGAGFAAQPCTDRRLSVSVLLQAGLPVCSSASGTGSWASTGTGPSQHSRQRTTSMR